MIEKSGGSGSIFLHEGGRRSVMHLPLSKSKGGEEWRPPAFVFCHIYLKCKEEEGWHRPAPVFCLCYWKEGIAGYQQRYKMNLANLSVLNPNKLRSVAIRFILCSAV